MDELFLTARRVAETLRRLPHVLAWLEVGHLPGFQRTVGTRASNRSTVAAI